MLALRGADTAASSHPHFCILNLRGTIPLEFVQPFRGRDAGIRYISFGYAFLGIHSELKGSLLHSLQPLR